MDHQAFAQLLGNYGEFVGAIAVVATLIYLAIQVRHSSHVIEINTGVVDADSWANLFQMELEFDRLLISDSDVMELWLRGGTKADLSETDFARWRLLVRGRINLARAGYQRARIGGTPQGRFVDLLARDIVSLPELRRIWSSTLGTNPEHLPDRDFVQAVNERIDVLQNEAGDTRA